MSHPHIETHFRAPEILRDLVLGAADGLTVPFALAAGLSGAVNSNTLVVTAGLAEIAAGALAMGLGGYLAARGEREHYYSERRREWQEVRDIPEHEEREVREIFAAYGLGENEMTPLVAALKRQPEKWVDFMMRFELGLEEPHPRRALQSGVTIGLAYVAGGLLPLSPYMMLHQTPEALRWSAGMTLVALFVFGYVKGYFTGVSRWKSGLQTLLVGAAAAFAAYAIAVSL